MSNDEVMTLELTDWRRLTAEMYAAVRRTRTEDARGAWDRFRRDRDLMFTSHAQSPLSPDARRTFHGLHYFPWNPALRFVVPVLPLTNPPKQGGDAPALTEGSIELPEGRLSYRPFGLVQFSLVAGIVVRLTLYWLQGYGGGLFVPFRDGTNGRETYGGGRYLYDTIKGADLGAGPREIPIDFNFAYNPSCAYDARWVCPLAPAENLLSVRIEAGELAFEAEEDRVRA
jgi:uncharacterized protein